MKYKMIYLVAIFGISISLSAHENVASNSDMKSESKNIIQLAQENGFNSLAAALTKTDLLSALQGDGPFTVFAPTDKAFATLLDAIGQKSIDDVPVSVLKQVLLYHVVSGEVMSSQVSDGMLTSLEGSELGLSTKDGIKVNGVSVIMPFDVDASNGVIHTVNDVIVPASVGQFVNTVLEPAYFNKNFSTLISAAVKADVVETLLTTPNLTIFAPDNAAFASAGINPDKLDSKTLASVLTYHVIGAKVLSSGIPREAVTVNGNKLFFSLVSSGAYINGNTMIKAVDIESGSGVVHVINQVLMPPQGNIVETALFLNSSGDFTSLVAALKRTASEGSPDQNLLNVLSGDGPFTVFAPTNAAFESLLKSNSEWATLSDIPLETLISVLVYHVVPARAYDKDLAGAINIQNELPTALGKNIAMDLDNLTVNANSSIIGVNTNTSNGVIHVINSVLIPN